MRLNKYFIREAHNNDAALTLCNFIQENFISENLDGKFQIAEKWLQHNKKEDLVQQNGR